MLAKTAFSCIFHFTSHLTMLLLYQHEGNFVRFHNFHIWGKEALLCLSSKDLSSLSISISTDSLIPLDRSKSKIKNAKNIPVIYGLVGNKKEKNILWTEIDIDSSIFYSFNSKKSALIITSPSHGRRKNPVGCEKKITIRRIFVNGLCDCPTLSHWWDKQMRKIKYL